MAIIKYDSKLCDMVIEEPSTLTVLNRFGIYLGLGDKTLTDVCHEMQLDIEFFSTILNTYINENYFPEDILKSHSINKLIEYFHKTNEYYLRFSIPNIDRHFNSLIQRSSADNNNLGLLRNFFEEVKNELLTRIESDKTILNAILSGTNSNEMQLLKPESEDLIEDKLNDLINMFVLHLKGNYDINLCQAVLISIMALKKDINQNNRLRYRILFPLIEHHYN
ncbi:MAG: helix-turn-helix transcriptional regulator [Muribaculaceae bacterium]|jgi:regulator of cell morphogenesis and NO signaling|nr:helix-turn-helix transcriptional regulator [Muribaculaceae bacterium]